jgi:hypothetical protein
LAVDSTRWLALSQQAPGCRRASTGRPGAAGAGTAAGDREEVAVTPINTGNARRKPARRGTATFVPYAAWVESGWESEALALGVPMRKRSYQPVEITVAGSVPDVMRFVVGVYKLPYAQTRRQAPNPSGGPPPACGLRRRLM